MITSQFLLPIAHELIVDLFAGGGGASTGIELAVGRHVDIAVNHDPQAVSLHQVNHPQTRHYVSDVFEVDPLAVTDGQPVGLLWASPDCKHFSKAKGGKPVSKKIRGLAWVVIKWAKLVQPRVICLENVEEFKTWGPLNADNMPCPERKGQTFQRWKKQLENLGYVVETRELRACDYGAPTIRKRLFVIARCDGEPIVWPAPTHGPGLRPYRTAADCIDWSIPCPSIFERERPLVEATMRRIAHGIKRYVIDSATPFIVPVTHQGDSRVHSALEPLRTITTAQRGEFALAAPMLLKHFGGEPQPGRTVSDLRAPAPTVLAQGGKQALCAAFLAKHYGGNEGPGVPVGGPVSTITTQDHHHLVAAHLAKFRFDSAGASMDAPAPTVTANSFVKRPGGAAPIGLVTSHLAKLRGTSNSAATPEPLGTVSAQGLHHAEVRALLLKFYGAGGQHQSPIEPLHTIPTHDRFGLVTVHGEDYFIADIGMRMLQPRELYRAQGFPDSYAIDRGADGKPLSKAAQVRMCGNSVCPPLAQAIVAANYMEAGAVRRAA
jgi:DNA (cytosine-5)-methyltransferase 1